MKLTASSKAKPKIPTYPFDEESVQCCYSGENDGCRNSSPSAPRSMTISISNVISIHATLSNRTAPPLSPRGASLVVQKFEHLAET
jgi:hypothetical protein